MVQAEFRKLNILLHCPDQSKPSLRYPQSQISITKVAIINMMGARIEAAICK